MNAQRNPRTAPVIYRQRGQVALLTVLLILGVGVTAIVYSLVTPATISLENDKKTAAALAQARDALIGFAAGVNVTGSQRPGDLPCPDRTLNDGIADTPCDTVARRIGRLPWKTLGIPDLRDGAGERLWYAVSNNFKNNNRIGTLNSDTLGEYTVTGLAPASNVIAVVFAPGASVATQDRNPATTALCTTIGTSIARNLCATNYLEGGNESGTTTFTTALSSSTFNDKLMLITSDNFFPAVTMRVARETRTFLQAYFNVNGYYPFANDYADPSFNCTLLKYSGRIPTGDLSNAPCNLLDWGGGAVLPPWFTPNNWHQVVFYAVAPACTSPLSLWNCLNLGGLLTVNGVPTPNNDKRAIVIVTGRGLTGQTRPCASVADCLEDPENTNSNNTYVNNLVTATVNDRLVIVAP